MSVFFFFFFFFFLEIRHPRETLLYPLSPVKAFPGAEARRGVTLTSIRATRKEDETQKKRTKRDGFSTTSTPIDHRSVEEEVKKAEFSAIHVP